MSSVLRFGDIACYRTIDFDLPDCILDALSELYWLERCPDLRG